MDPVIIAIISVYALVVFAGLAHRYLNIVSERIRTQVIYGSTNG